MPGPSGWERAFFLEGAEVVDFGLLPGGDVIPHTGLESGERTELNSIREGERLETPFEISEGGVLPPGSCDRFPWKPQVAPSPDLQVDSFVKYDDESETVAANTRLRWTFYPCGDPFVVQNLDLPESRPGGWTRDSNQLVMRVREGLPF